MARARMLGAVRSPAARRHWEIAAAGAGARRDAGGSRRARAAMDRVRWTDAAWPRRCARPVAGTSIDPRDFDAEDWWYRCRFTSADCRQSLSGFGSRASRRSPTSGSTDEHILHSENMFVAHTVDIDARSAPRERTRSFAFMRCRRCWRAERPRPQMAHRVWSRIRRFAGTARRCSVGCPAGVRRSRRSARGGRS